MITSRNALQKTEIKLLAKVMKNELPESFMRNKCDFQLLYENASYQGSLINIR